MTKLATRDEQQSWRARIRNSRLGTLLVLAVTALLVMGGSYLVDRSKADPGVTPVSVSGSGPAPKTGDDAPGFSATTVAGQRVSLSSLLGHPVWLTFGATWCSACQAEAPDIETAYQKAKSSGVVVVAIYLSENSASVRGFGNRLGLDFTQIADPETRIASAYRVYGIPAHFFIDRTGVVRSVKTGSLNPDQMDSQLAAIAG
jgi:peroxiredoxin